MARQNLSKFYILGCLLTAIGLLIFLNSFGWLELPKRVFYWASVPILKPFHLIGLKTSQAFKTLINLKDLIKENSRLKKENQDLISKVTDLAQLVEQNELLRQQLQMKPPLKSKIVMANLVGFDANSLGQYFLINKGRIDGLSVNQAVIFAGGFLIGKIAQVEDNLSKVLSLTDSQSSIFGLTQETRVPGMVKGDHGVGLVMEMVSPQKEIHEGEIIITSGLDGFLPKGLIIGQVEKKLSLESEAFQKFKVKPAINYKDLEIIFVILGNE